MPLAKDVNLKQLARETKGYVGADIEAICREAGMLALRDNIKITEVNSKYFKEALTKVRPSASKEMVDSYKDLEEQYLKKAKAGIARAAA